MFVIIEWKTANVIVIFVVSLFKLILKLTTEFGSPSSSWTTQISSTRCCLIRAVQTKKFNCISFIRVWELIFSLNAWSLLAVTSSWKSLSFPIILIESYNSISVSTFSCFSKTGYHASEFGLVVFKSIFLFFISVWVPERSITWLVRFNWTIADHLFAVIILLDWLFLCKSLNNLCLFLSCLWFWCISI